MEEKREVFEVDVLLVGAGPACLAAAYHLSRLIAEHNSSASSSADKLEAEIALIEKGSEVGAHSFSGAVIDPIALAELVPDYRDRDCPLESEVTSDAVYYLTRSSRLKLPMLPPSLSNEGNAVVSLARLNRWLGKLVEQEGVNIFPGFAGVEILEEDGKVVGIRTGEKGIDPQGNRKSNYEPGIDLRAKVTVFGDGPRGFLSKQLIARHNLTEGKIIQAFETGVKEIFEVPSGSIEPGTVIHTLGHPFRRDCVGGSFIYAMADNLITIGLVVPLDYRDPFINPHRLLQELKTHPMVKKILSGGKSAYYGAKVISAAGYFSIPRLYTDGALIIGEAASLVDMKRLKGIHLAMKSGMLAAETIFSSLLKDDFSTASLKGYEDSLYRSYVGQSLYKVRHFHRALSLGLPRALPHLLIQQLTGGMDLLSYDGIEEDYKTLLSVREYYGRDATIPDGPPADGTYILDKLSDVYNSGTIHIEDQPPHLKILDPNRCIDVCLDKYKYPCNRFCPANVYEMTKEDEKGYRLQVNFTNCVHCQTCDIKCPLDNIRWTPPEGGGGPNYTVM